MRVRVGRAIEASASIAQDAAVESGWIPCPGSEKLTAVGLKVTGTAPQCDIAIKTRQNSESGTESQYITVITGHDSDAQWSGDPDAYGEAAVTVIEANQYKVQVTNKSVNNVVIDDCFLIFSADN
jgi:hypothetical protein